MPSQAFKCKSPKDLFAIKPSLLSFLSPPFSYMSREITGVPVMLNSKASSLFCWFGEIGDVLWNVCECNVLECKLPPVWCYLSPSGLQALGVLCIMQMGQEWVRDAQHSDQKPFASVFLLCVHVPLAAGKWEQRAVTGKRGEFPFLLNILTLNISQTKYLSLSSSVQDVARHKSVKTLNKLNKKMHLLKPSLCRWQISDKYHCSSSVVN